MLEQPARSILIQDKQSYINDYMSHSVNRRNPRKLKFSTNQQRSGLQSVLHHVSKQKLYDNIVSTLHKQPKIQLYYRKLLNEFNQSTLTARKKNKKRNSILNRQHQTISNCETGRSNKLINHRKLTTSKQTIIKKQNITLPLMKSVSFKDQDINPKDKRIQDIFLKIGKRESNQFVYDVNFPKKLLLDYISQEFSPKFSAYFNWFMELRPIIDYYYFVSIGNRFMKMDIYKIAHFAYSALEGFSYQNSLQIFINNYGSKDLITILDNRDNFKPPPIGTINYFQKKTLTELQQHKSTPRIHRVVMKSNTLYRRTFQFHQLTGSEQIQKKHQGHKRKRGQITFEQFCSLYAKKIPNVYKVVLQKLYCIQIIDSQKGFVIDRRDQSYNRERNATRESFSQTKKKDKKKERWHNSLN